MCTGTSEKQKHKEGGKRSLELVSISDIFAHHDSSLLPRPVSKIHECHSRIVLQWFSAVWNTLDCACRRMSSQSDRVSVRISMMRTRKYVNLRVYTRYLAREKKVHFRAYGEYSQEYSRSTHNNNCAISSSPDTQVFATRRFLRQVDTGMFENHLDAIPRRKIVDGNHSCQPIRRCQQNVQRKIQPLGNPIITFSHSNSGSLPSGGIHTTTTYIPNCWLFLQVEIWCHSKYDQRQKWPSWNWGVSSSPNKTCRCTKCQ